MNKRSEVIIGAVTDELAAFVWNHLSEIAKLPSVEGFEWLAERFRTAFLSYYDGLGRKTLPEPSRN
jgi:hypothetical protein